MKRCALLLAAFLSCAFAATSDTPKRPRITGIDHVIFYSTNLDSTSAFYTKFLGLPSTGGGCAGVLRRCFPVNLTPVEQVELEQSPSPAPKNWLAELAFATSDVAQMRRYLTAKGVAASKISKDSNGAQHFELRDPEGNPIAFVQQPLTLADYEVSPSQISTRLLHAGFVVKDMAAENRFYIETLGFQLYWYGGFKDDGVDWYEIQVPDGDNWIEYMLNISPTADHREIGVQNHFSLGVRDAAAAAALLRSHGATKFDGPEIGRDGKNALDIYDPDLSRVEIMDFTPSQNPCCHPYTAPHPKP